MSACVVPRCIRRGGAVMQIEVWLLILIVLAAPALGAGVMWTLVKQFSTRSMARATKEAESVVAAARAQAEARSKTIELQAEKAATERRHALDREMQSALADVKASQSRAEKREETLDRKLEQIGQREQKLESREQRIADLEKRTTELQANLETERAAVREQIEKVAGMTMDEARELYMAEVRRHADHDAAVLAQKIVEEAERDARDKARQITLLAIQRYAAENATETTVRTVKIPSDDVKGRIIGREGRNIRTIERATGADILVDDTPGVISVSCFDKVRQAIAAETLQRLVADGRIHPTRIEELVAQVTRDINERIQKDGQAAVLETNLRGLHPKVIEAMGKLAFRTSYGQNVLRHSVEVAFLCQMIADELGLDGTIARRAGFLHDIGKAMDHEMEGGHPAIGVEFLRKHGEKSEAVLNAVGGHHADIPATTPYTPIVMAADAISSARPGARRESMELYVKRLQQLEALAREHEFVDEAYAIQAGREVRVVVDAKKADDAYAFRIAQEIAKRVEEEMTFPGEIKVTVLREVRAEATAR
ncbi:MAG: ribonuclease Y [Phycisphaerales bacterium]|nr:ribonuclease Y [Phycisphaerales bacterium]PHX78143.1 MAG: ribonuclease Y [Planctomycetaceae bacterium]